MRRTPAALLSVALLVVGCAGPEASLDATAPATSAATASAGVTTATPVASEDASAEPSPLLTVEAPGHPYDGDDVLALLADSRRPDGVPAEIQRPDIAATLAQQIWTIGGRAWESTSVGGSCGPQSCDLELAGAPGGGAGEDLYVFRIDRASGSVELLQSVLLGLDPETVEVLDRLVRERVGSRLDGYGLATVRWLPPPEDGRYVLSYRSGGEEGSPALDLEFDTNTGEVTEMPASWVRSARG